MKILVVRFSSIGDVVLTTPIVRCLKQQIPNATIHFITKKAFEPVLKDNPYIDQLITIQKSIDEVMDELKAVHYDWVIDLHKNVRTLALKRKLGVPNKSFPKKNIEKWLLVNFKVNKMGSHHIVDRYFETVQHLGIKNDAKPCDFFIHPTQEIDTLENFNLQPKTYLVVAIGAQFQTKRMPLEKLVEVLRPLSIPIVLAGGKMDADLANELIRALPSHQIKNACGPYNLQQSASIVKQAKVMLANDTGLMHIASCFQLPTVSVWGNTVPELGMYPYFPSNPTQFTIHQVANLSCRPCSKIGFKSCPKKHFNCMQLQDAQQITEAITQF